MSDHLYRGTHGIPAHARRVHMAQLRMVGQKMPSDENYWPRVRVVGRSNQKRSNAR